MKQLRLKNVILQIDSCYNCPMVMGYDGNEFCSLNTDIPCEYEITKEKQINHDCPLEDYEIQQNAKQCLEILNARKEMLRLKQSLDFYKRRCDALNKLQSKMRDPERTILCDILANGKLLYPSIAGNRYGGIV